MTAAGAPTVFVIDDDAGVRAAIQGLLKSWLAIRVFWQAARFPAQRASRRTKLSSVGCAAARHRRLEFQQELANAGVLSPIIFITGMEIFR